MPPCWRSANVSARLGGRPGGPTVHHNNVFQARKFLDAITDGSLSSGLSGKRCADVWGPMPRSRCLGEDGKPTNAHPWSGHGFRFSFQDWWCRVRDSNPRPPDYKSGALPTELTRLGRGYGARRSITVSRAAFQSRVGGPCWWPVLRPEVAATARTRSLRPAPFGSHLAI